jgi:4a-hydroxytetrahydrobiopterin dehydratase
MEVSMPSELAKMECVPCKGGIPPLRGEKITDLLVKLGNGWQVREEHHLEKDFRFRNFREALDFTNRVGELAETVNHHPDINLGWGKVRLIVWTHKIGGLSETDFVFAAKADVLLKPQTAA